MCANATGMHPLCIIRRFLAPCRARASCSPCLGVSGSATDLLRLLMQHLKQAPAKAQANQKLRRRACRRRGLLETRPTRFRLRRNVRAHCCLDARGVADVSWDVTQDRQVCAWQLNSAALALLGRSRESYRVSPLDGDPMCAAALSGSCGSWVGWLLLFVCAVQIATPRGRRGESKQTSSSSPPDDFLFFLELLTCLFLDSFFFSLSRFDRIAISQSTRQRERNDESGWPRMTRDQDAIGDLV